MCSSINVNASSSADPLLGGDGLPHADRYLGIVEEHVVRVPVAVAQGQSLLASDWQNQRGQACKGKTPRLFLPSCLFPPWTLSTQDQPKVKEQAHEQTGNASSDVGPGISAQKHLFMHVYLSSNSWL